MTAKEKDIKKHADFSKETEEMIAGTYIEWGKSKEQIWAELEQRMETKQPAGRSIIMSTGPRLCHSCCYCIAGRACCYSCSYIPKPWDSCR